MNDHEGGSVPLYLNKINSDQKAIACAIILEAGHPHHNERLWLVGFLKFAGYSMTEVFDIIHEHCQWADYNDRITRYQVGTVFHHRPQQTQNHVTSKIRKWDLTPVEVLRIRRQKSISLSKLLCEENNGYIFPHPERLGSDDGPTAAYLKK